MAEALPEAVTRYLRRRPLPGSWRIDPEGEGYAGGVVIPARAESETVMETLRSLAADPSPGIDRFLVLVVVNAPEGCDPREAEDNRRTIRLLREACGSFPFRLAVVDAAGEGLGLPPRQAGVGLARRIGADLLLPRLDWSGDPPILFLDADTLVEPGYLAAVCGTLSRHSPCGATIPFSHLPAPDPLQQEIIDRYEIFLRSWRLGLLIAGSPYGFHSVGSAMACTGSAYLRAGGMNMRQAGEDFAFLQEIAKTTRVVEVAGTTVHPSPRRSWRVPFGTGRMVGRGLDEGVEAIRWYDPAIFPLLRSFLSGVDSCRTVPLDEVEERLAGIHGELLSFLRRERFSGALEGLRRVHADPDRFRRGFHQWFDALRTVRLINHLSERGFPRSADPGMVRRLMEEAGGEAPSGEGGILPSLRALEERITPGVFHI